MGNFFAVACLSRVVKKWQTPIMSEEIDCEAMELVEQEEEEEESKARVGHALQSLIFPAVSVSACFCCPCSCAP